MDYDDRKGGGGRSSQRDNKSQGNQTGTNDKLGGRLERVDILIK